MGKKETLTTLALPGEGKWDTSPRGRGRARKTDALLFTVYCRRGTAKRRQHYKTHRPLKGKLLTTFCASLALLHPLLSLTHWIFRSLILPYKSSSHSAKCVRCASLRSGVRRLAVRTAREYPIGALPCTPFASSRHFPSRGNEGYEEKNSESYTSGTISAFSPFGGWRHHLSPASGGTIKLRYAVSCL